VAVGYRHRVISVRAVKCGGWHALSTVRGGAGRFGAVGAKAMPPPRRRRHGFWFSSRFDSSQRVGGRKAASSRRSPKLRQVGQRAVLAEVRVTEAVDVVAEAVG
jgi:hypothetical protein